MRTLKALLAILFCLLLPLLGIAQSAVDENIKFNLNTSNTIATDTGTTSVDLNGSTSNSLKSYFMPQNVRSLDRYMTLSIAEAAISFVYEAGAEWRVYSSNGVLIGKDYVDNYSLMLIDGYGLSDGEAMRLFYYSPTTTNESLIKINSWVEKSTPNGLDASFVFYHESSLYPASLEFDLTTKLMKVESTVSLTVYPNPTVDNVTVEVELNKSTNVAVELLGTSGQKLLRKDYGVIEVGCSNFDLNVSTLAAGVYFLNVYVGEGFKTHKLLLIK